MNWLNDEKFMHHYKNFKDAVLAGDRSINLCHANLSYTLYVLLKIAQSSSYTSLVNIIESGLDSDLNKQPFFLKRLILLVEQPIALQEYKELYNYSKKLYDFSQKHTAMEEQARLTLLRFKCNLNQIIFVLKQLEAKFENAFKGAGMTLSSEERYSNACLTWINSINKKIIKIKLAINPNNADNIQALVKNSNSKINHIGFVSTQLTVRKN